jgi:hypothetical protein
MNRVAKKTISIKLKLTEQILLITSKNTSNFFINLSIYSYFKLSKSVSHKINVYPFFTTNR